MKVTGYPNFASLKERDVAEQFKLVWDALRGLSDDAAGLVIPDVSSLEADLAKERSRRALLEKRIVDGLQGVLGDRPVQRGAAFISPAGALAVVCWRAPYTCVVLNVRGYRAGGTGATVNARKNGSLTHLASNLSLTSAGVWMDGGAVQNTTYAVGDSLELLLQSVTGSPTQVGIQVDLRRA